MPKEELVQGKHCLTFLTNFCFEFGAQATSNGCNSGSEISHFTCRSANGNSTAGKRNGGKTIKFAMAADHFMIELKIRMTSCQ